MFNISKIAVAVDFSDTSVNALKMALELGEKFNAQLAVVHCAPIAAVSLPEEGHPKINEKLLKKELAKARTNLDALVSVHAGNNKNITQHVIWGEPTTEVNKYVVENGIDLIVIGTHGRTGLKHLLMGSVAESVLRHANVPVMCIRSS